MCLDKRKQDNLSGQPPLIFFKNYKTDMSAREQFSKDFSEFSTLNNFGRQGEIWDVSGDFVLTNFEDDFDGRSTNGGKNKK